MKTPVATLIRKAINNASTRNLVQPFTKTIRFKGKEYKLELKRRFEPRHVSVCTRPDCGAGSDCCHIMHAFGITLCNYGDSVWDVMDEKLGVIFANMCISDEEKVWEHIYDMLRIIERMDGWNHK